MILLILLNDITSVTHIENLLIFYLDNNTPKAKKIKLFFVGLFKKKKH